MSRVKKRVYWACKYEVKAMFRLQRTKRKSAIDFSIASIPNSVNRLKKRSGRKRFFNSWTQKYSAHQRFLAFDTWSDFVRERNIVALTLRSVDTSLARIDFVKFHATECYVHNSHNKCKYWTVDLFIFKNKNNIKKNEILDLTETNINTYVVTTSFININLIFW